MATTYASVLAPDVILGVVDRVLGGLPSFHMPSGLLGGVTSRAVRDNVGRIIRSTGTQQTAKQGARGSASRSRTIDGVSDRPQVLIHSFENMEVKFQTLMGLIQADEQTGNAMAQANGELAKTEFARIQRQAATLSQNLRTAAVTSAFALGHIYFDGDGNLLPSSSGAAIDIDYSIPSENLNQVNSIIDVTWATATTKIHKHVELIKAHALKQSGRPLRHAIAGANILTYLLGNNYTKDLIFNNQNASGQVLQTGQVSFNWCGLTWWPGYYDFFRDNSGTAQSLIGDDAIVFLPEPSPDWYEMQEGLQPIPGNGFGDGMSFADALAKTEYKQGVFQYLDGQKDPMSGKLMYGDNFLPAIHVPEAVIIADVTP